MHDSTSDQHNVPQAKGLLRPGRFLWARALPWGVVLGTALWFAYKFTKGMGIGLGLGGTGLPTTLGVRQCR